MAMSFCHLQLHHFNASSRSTVALQLPSHSPALEIPGIEFASLSQAGDIQQALSSCSRLQLGRSSTSLRGVFSVSSIRGRHQRKQFSVYMMLPSANFERTSSTHWPKWSARAIKAFSMAELEARKMKYPTTGTDALLMGTLTEGTSQASRYLRCHGITLFGVRDETVKILGKADMYFFSPEHPPLTEPAQKALDWAVEERIKAGEDAEVTATHLVLGIWAQKGSAGQQVLTNLGFDDKNAEELEALVNG